MDTTQTWQETAISLKAFGFSPRTIFRAIRESGNPISFRQLLMALEASSSEDCHERIYMEGFFSSPLPAEELHHLRTEHIYYPTKRSKDGLRTYLDRERRENEAFMRIDPSEWGVLP